MTLSAQVKAVMKGNGGSGTVNLIEIVTQSGVALFISDQRLVANSVLTGDDAVTYQPWLTGHPSYHEYRSTQTSTASFEVQNLSGDTVTRDTARYFSANELAGALVFARIWRTDAEEAIYSFLGKLDEPELDGDSLSCSASGFDNWSLIKAPPFKIDASCGLDFGSTECGSTSSTPCNQSYGTCSSLERFKGVVIQWNGAPLAYVQISQPAQTVQMNNARPF